MSFEEIHRLCARLKEAGRQSGRSVLSMAAEIAWLRLFGLRAYDYFWLQLYLPTPGFRKTDFLGCQLNKSLNDRLNRRSDWGLVDDKLICQTLLSSVDLPCPRLHGVYVPGGRASSLCRVLSTPDELRSFLSETSYPLFCKPVSEGGGKGCFRAEEWYDTGVVMHDGAHLSLVELVKLAETPGRFGGPGLLFSSVIQPHRTLLDLSPFPCTLRIAVVLADRPKLLGSFMRLPRAGSLLDSLGAHHRNLAAKVELQGGLLSQAVSGICPRQRRYRSHPDTGAPIQGRQLPFWRDCVEIVESGSRLFPNLRLQGWDLAITDNGPLVVEVNVRSCIQSLQHPTREPLLTPQVREWFTLATAESIVGASTRGAEP